MNSGSSNIKWIWLGLVGFWVIASILVTTQSYFSWNNEGYSVTWTQAAALEGVRWGLWIVISIFILWLVRRIPIRRESWKSGLFIHFLIGLGICLLHFSADTGMNLMAAPWPLSSNSFFELYLDRLGSIRIHLSLALYWAILGFAHAIDYYSKFSEREVRALHLEHQLTQAQLQALKMQLNPHFLFNTLNSIASLVRLNQNKKATDMIAHLSDLLRLIQETSGAQEITLKQELEFLGRYLEIEQIRFEDRLKVIMNVQKESLGGKVPNLILQPLVENAIRHGIGSNPESGTIEIVAQRKNGNLELSILNTSKDPGHVPDISKEGEGVGLSNTRARLEKLYGHEHTLEIDANVGNSFRVLLRLPFNEGQEDHGISEKIANSDNTHIFR